MSNLISLKDPDGFIVASRTELTSGWRVADVDDGCCVALVNADHAPCALSLHPTDVERVAAASID